MEHSVLQDWKKKSGIVLDGDIEKKLIKYAELIHVTNSKFNLTGFKSVDEIIINLIIGSIDPFRSMNVPRGTVFADIGAGAGIPGIPLGVYCDKWKGVCIDSNNKKMSFVDSVIQECKIDNMSVCNGRLETLAREQMRNAFDYVFSRALGEMFFVVEVGAPLLKIGGLLYIYSNITPEDIPQRVKSHLQQLGLSLINRDTYGDYGIKKSGILLRKNSDTDIRYPRNMTAIKRDIKRNVKGL